jgi:hypothetical protein
VTMPNSSKPDSRKNNTNPERRITTENIGEFDTRELFKHRGQIPVMLEHRPSGWAIRCQGVVIGVGSEYYAAAADATEGLRYLADAIERWMMGDAGVEPTPDVWAGDDGTDP